MPLTGRLHDKKFLKCNQGGMPENFEEMVTMKEITFRTYLLYFVMQFVFQNTCLILLKTENTFHPRWHRITQIEGQISSYQNISRLQTERVLRYFGCIVLICVMFNTSSEMTFCWLSRKMEAIPRIQNKQFF